jgi:radical SAM protein with 4Fe4S-binding SPASM domain
MISSLHKSANLLAAGYSYLKSSASGNPVMSGLPVSLSTELTNNCNLHCPQCASGSGLMERKHGFMEKDLFIKVIKELGPYLYNLNLYFQGEPMLHPLFFTFLDNCRDTHTVVSTNGHFLSEENAEKIVNSHLNKLIISIDGLDQKTYSAYRVDGDLSKVLEGIKSVSRIKEKSGSSLEIELQFLVNRFNESQIPEVKQLAGSVNAKLSLKSMQIINNREIETWMPSKKIFRRYEKEDGHYAIKSSFKNRCARMWFNPVITWDGKVVPCCFDKDAEYIMGDLKIDTFRDIWDGPKYRIFRKSILTGRHMIEMCRNCTSGLKGVNT